jgi:hypothetical protein
MLFQNYGLFWQADKVKWGSKGKNNQGSLDGVWASAKREGFVDFREQRGIYVLYDDTFRIIYVGQAGRGQRCLFARLKDHMRDDLAGRWTKFSWFGTRPVNDRYELEDSKKITPSLAEVLNHLEAILIAAAEPPLNRQGGKFGRAEKYLQRTD